MNIDGTDLSGDTSSQGWLGLGCVGTGSGTAQYLQCSRCCNWNTLYLVSWYLTDTPRLSMLPFALSTQGDLV